MATQIVELPKSTRPAFWKEKKYNLDQYLDGHAWKFSKGEDFTCKPSSFGTILNKAAKVKGLKSAIRIRGDHVYFQIVHD